MYLAQHVQALVHLCEEHQSSKGYVLFRCVLVLPYMSRYILPPVCPTGRCHTNALLTLFPSKDIMYFDYAVKGMVFAENLLSDTGRVRGSAGLCCFTGGK